MAPFPCFWNIALYFSFALGSANYVPGPAYRCSSDPSPLELNLKHWWHRFKTISMIIYLSECMDHGRNVESTAVWTNTTKFKEFYKAMA